MSEPEPAIIWKPGSTYNPVQVTDMSDGFAVCRERDKPTVVQLPDGNKHTLYPSGRAVKHFTAGAANGL